MWHLLKTEWSTKKYIYFIPFIFPGSYFFYRIIQSFDKWVIEPRMNNIIALIVGFACVIPLGEAIYKENTRNSNATRMLFKMPVAHWKLHAVRLLSGAPTYGSLMTLIVALILFSMRHQIGERYTIILALHGLLVSSQILHLMVDDLTYKWNGRDARGFCMIFIPIFFLVTILILYGRNQ